VNASFCSESLRRNSSTRAVLRHLPREERLLFPIRRGGVPTLSFRVTVAFYATWLILCRRGHLIDGIARGLPDDLEEVYRRYAALLKSVIMQVLHSEAEASEVLQDVFCQVWNHADHYSAGKGKLANWLCTLARRRAIDRLRQQSAYRRATKRYKIASRHFENCLDRLHTVELQVFDNDLRSLLRQHLSSLPAQQREMIRLAFFEQRSQREISRLTNIPLGTVKTRIELGLRKLSKRLIEKRRKVL
jgi:RNA polymerase sigma-70 factor, ECF subfamily